MPGAADVQMAIVETKPVTLERVCLPYAMISDRQMLSQQLREQQFAVPAPEARRTG